MTSFLTSLYLLSFKQTETVHSPDLDCIKISNKRACTQGLYCDAKSEFFRSRCNDCKQHWGWKKSINSVEKLFKSYKCIFSSWELNQPLLLLFSNGSIVSIELNVENNTLKKIEIDNNLSGKIIASRIVDAIISENYIFITYSEPKLTVIHINQESPSFSAKILGKKRGKLVGFDPKITHIDLFGPSSKNLERKLSLNSCKDHLLVWWKFSSDLVWPWNPSVYGDRAERVNMLIYSLNECIEILCTVKVQGELINAKYSKQYSNQILTIEELRSEKETSINVSVYEIVGDQCHHVFISKLPLQGRILSFDWSSTDKLLISDSNNILLVFDLRKKTSIVTNLLYSPKSSVWHPQDCIALVTGTSGQVQCFDAALTCIKFKLYYKTNVDCKVLELSSHFTQSCCAQKLLWQKSDLSNSCLLWLDSDLSTFIVLKFTFGSISRNSLSAFEVISQYLKSSSIDEAILLLMSLNWWYSSKLHFRCLSKIANFLLRKPLNLQVQAGLEMALGTFYNNAEIMPKRTCRLYEHKVNHLARRFFHQLLRHHQFRKAFLLAVDLESQDLFLDLSHVAKQKGENVLALVAFHKANELDGSQESISGSSSCSSATDVSSTSYGRTGKWEDMDPHALLNENSVVESADHRHWLPVSKKSALTDNWLNSSELNTHLHQTLHNEPVAQDLFTLPKNCDKLSTAFPQLHASSPSSKSSLYHKVQTTPTLTNSSLPDSSLLYSKPAVSHKNINQKQMTQTFSYSGSNSSQPEAPIFTHATTSGISSYSSQSCQKSNADVIHYQSKNIKASKSDIVSILPSNVDEKNDKLHKKAEHSVAQPSCDSSSTHKLRVISNFSPKPLPDPLSHSPNAAISPHNLSHTSSYRGSNLSHHENLKGISSLALRPLPDLPSYPKTSEPFENLHQSQNMQLIANKSLNVNGQSIVDKSELKNKEKHPVIQACYGSNSYNKLRVIPTLNPKPLPEPHSYSRTTQFHKTNTQDNSPFHISSHSSSSTSHPRNINVAPTLPPRPLPKLSPYSRTSGSYEGLCSDINAIRSQSKQIILNKFDNSNRQPMNVSANHVDEENDELEDSVIKLSHFGII